MSNVKSGKSYLMVTLKFGAILTRKLVQNTKNSEAGV